MQTNINVKTMRIHVILFASFSDFLGESKLDMDVNYESTIKDLQNLLFSKLSPNKTWNKPLLYAVNQSFTALDTKLNDGDEVVFMPFVSGG